MIGIGGCGMAGLARMLRARGAIVSGSDAMESEATVALAAEGVPVSHDQRAGTLPQRCDLVVASAAIRPEHPQLMAARERGVPVLTYAQALGRCMATRTAVAVAGTHGKSTTTAMLGAALVDAGLDPTVIVGASCRQLAHGCLAPPGQEAGRGTPRGPVGFRLGSDTIPRGPFAGRPGLLVAEACEFNRSFHNYYPLVASISAVEADHLDIYGTMDAVVEAFAQFARQVAPRADGGLLLIAHEGAHRREVAAGARCRVETLGFSPEADWSVEFDAGTRQVRVRHRGRDVAQWVTCLPGAHNALNGAFACALAVSLGAEAPTVARSLGAFTGVDRRMQFLGERAAPGGPVRVYDDYAHHPTEVAATLRALRQFERPAERGGRLICVFQPHQHSRTRHLLEEFAAAFCDADVVIVPQIYFVRDSEEERQKVTAADLVRRLRARGVRAMHLDPFEAIAEHLLEICRGDDVLVFMGAGPVWKIARLYLGQAPEAPGLGQRGREPRADGAGGRAGQAVS